MKFSPDTYASPEEDFMNFALPNESDGIPVYLFRAQHLTLDQIDFGALEKDFKVPPKSLKNWHGGIEIGSGVGDVQPRVQKDLLSEGPKQVGKVKDIYKQGVTAVVVTKLGTTYFEIFSRLADKRWVSVKNNGFGDPIKRN